MVATRAVKRNNAASNSPLHNAGILQQILAYAGAGQYLFIGPVSRAFRESYNATPDIKVESVDTGEQITVGRCTTRLAAVFQSATRVQLAHACGLQLHTTAKSSTALHYIAGETADEPTLLEANRLGLPKSIDVSSGAAGAPNLAKLKWMVTEQHYPISVHTTEAAARCGSVAVLEWLHQQGVKHNQATAEVAAESDQLAVLQYLWKCSGSIMFDDSVSRAAAENGRLAVLQWLRSTGDCQWDSEDIMASAAKSGSVPLMKWIAEQDPDVELDEEVMYHAAQAGHTAVCEWLNNHECPWDEHAVHVAARAGHLDTVRWLVQNGCEYDATTIGSWGAQS
eukprot:10486-Heterococcus_DN1.PRE.1